MGAETGGQSYGAGGADLVFGCFSGARCRRGARTGYVTLLKTMRFSRGISIAGAVALSVFGLTAAPAQQKTARDWVKDPAVVQIETTEDVFAIGDVHGDRDRLVKLLSGAGLVAGVEGAAGEVRWTAGKAIVVFTGDMIDKGPKPVETLSLLRALGGEAAQAGGRVVVLMGNHEADFLRDPGSEKASDFAAHVRAAGLDPKEVAACGGELGRFLCAMPFAARVNDWFFSHAGNTGGRTMGRLIDDLQSGFDRDGFATAQLTGGNSLLQARIGAQGPGGVSWYETAGARQSAGERLAANAAALGVAHIVQGHQHAEARFPDGKVRRVGEMYQWHGRLFLIDVGMSRDIGESAGAILHIRGGAGGEAEGICPGGRRTKLWDGRQKPDSARGMRCRS
jgi:hypothetical protein